MPPSPTAIWSEVRRPGLDIGVTQTRVHTDTDRTLQVDPQVITDIQQTACSGWTTELETVPAVLDFVVDTSYSMAEKLVQGTTWPLQGQGPTKWQITHDALVPALDDLGATVSARMVIFPNHAIVNQTFTTPQPQSTCFNPSNAVAVNTLGAAGSPQRTALSTALAAIAPNGNTPTFEAYAYGVTQMQEVTGFEGQKYMVLMTDGVPTSATAASATARKRQTTSSRPTQSSN